MIAIITIITNKIEKSMKLSYETTRYILMLWPIYTS